MSNHKMKYVVKMTGGETFEKDYPFDTHAEALAFIKGVEESQGWLDYDYVVTRGPFYVQN